MSDHICGSSKGVPLGESRMYCDDCGGATMTLRPVAAPIPEEPEIPEEEEEEEEEDTEE